MIKLIDTTGWLQADCFEEYVWSVNRVGGRGYPDRPLTPPYVPVWYTAVSTCTHLS